ncbi:unnamed protein product [Amoebophrya sp. A25]|nr:unnamed protein product [Amoebophrya sp. A25]|eukprot:GSA25T00022283001.1
MAAADVLLEDDSSDDDLDLMGPNSLPDEYRDLVSFSPVETRARSMLERDVDQILSRNAALLRDSFDPLQKYGRVAEAMSSSSVEEPPPRGLSKQQELQEKQFNLNQTSSGSPPRYQETKQESYHDEQDDEQMNDEADDDEQPLFDYVVPPPRQSSISTSKEHDRTIGSKSTRASTKESVLEEFASSGGGAASSNKVALPEEVDGDESVLEEDVDHDVDESVLEDVDPEDGENSEEDDDEAEKESDSESEASVLNTAEKEDLALHYATAAEENEEKDDDALASSSVLSVLKVELPRVTLVDEKPEQTPSSTSLRPITITKFKTTKETMTSIPIYEVEMDRTLTHADSLDNFTGFHPHRLQQSSEASSTLSYADNKSLDKSDVHHGSVYYYSRSEDAGGGGAAAKASSRRITGSTTRSTPRSSSISGTPSQSAVRDAALLGTTNIPPDDHFPSASSQFMSFPQAHAHAVDVPQVRRVHGSKTSTPLQQREGPTSTTVAGRAAPAPGGSSSSSSSSTTPRTSSSVNTTSCSSGGPSSRARQFVMPCNRANVRLVASARASTTVDRVQRMDFEPPDRSLLISASRMATRTTGQTSSASVPRQRRAPAPPIVVDESSGVTDAASPVANDVVNKPNLPGQKIKVVPTRKASATGATAASIKASSNSPSAARVVSSSAAAVSSTAQPSPKPSRRAAPAPAPASESVARTRTPPPTVASSSSSTKRVVMKQDAQKTSSSTGPIQPRTVGTNAKNVVVVPTTTTTTSSKSKTSASSSTTTSSKSKSSTTGGNTTTAASHNPRSASLRTPRPAMQQRPRTAETTTATERRCIASSTSIRAGFREGISSASASTTPKNYTSNLRNGINWTSGSCSAGGVNGKNVPPRGPRSGSNTSTRTGTTGASRNVANIRTPSRNGVSSGRLQGPAAGGTSSSSSKPKPEWNSTVTDLNRYRLDPNVQQRKKTTRVSTNLTLATAEMQEKISSMKRDIRPFLGGPREGERPSAVFRSAVQTGRIPSETPRSRDFATRSTMQSKSVSSVTGGVSAGTSSGSSHYNCGVKGTHRPNSVDRELEHQLDHFHDLDEFQASTTEQAGQNFTVNDAEADFLHGGIAPKPLSALIDEQLKAFRRPGE